MVRKTIAVVPLILILILFINGCSNESNKVVKSNQKNGTVTNKDTQESKEQITSSLHPTNSEIPTVSSKDAWNSTSIKSIDCILPDKRGWFPFSMYTDGVIVATVPPQDNKAEEIILYNTINNTYKTIAKLNKECQHGSASINDKWVIWTESLDQSFLNWKIHVYNRITCQDKVVFQTPKGSNGDGYPGPEPMPKLCDNEFVWSQPVGIGENNETLINIKKYNLITNSIEDVISQGANPNITKNYLIWMGKDKNTDNSKSALFWNKLGKPEQISTNDEIEFFANSGDSIAWSGHKISDPNKWVLGLIEDQKDQLLLETDNSNALQFLTMSSRFIAWTEYHKIQVYDRNLKKFVTLQDNDASYSSTFTNENFLYWTSPIIKDSVTRDIDAKKQGIYLTRLNILDINSLK